jgi:hypothetical protein
MNLQLLFIIVSVFFQGIYMQAVSGPGGPGGNGTSPVPPPNGTNTTDTGKIIQGYFQCPSVQLQYCPNSYKYCTCCGNSCRCLP